MAHFHHYRYCTWGDVIRSQHSRERKYSPTLYTSFITVLGTTRQISSSHCMSGASLFATPEKSSFLRGLLSSSFAAAVTDKRSCGTFRPLPPLLLPLLDVAQLSIACWAA